MPDPTSFGVDEQESGSYFATVTDDLGVVIPGSQLVTLQLTLWVVLQSGSTYIVNGRNRQNVLNQNNVAVYDTLQALGDGRTYNLRWNFQPLDTAMQEAIPFERHNFLFEWSWAQGQGKHEATLLVKNLVFVA
jgi:hypothetical protein